MFRRAQGSQELTSCANSAPWGQDAEDMNWVWAWGERDGDAFPVSRVSAQHLHTTDPAYRQKRPQKSQGHKEKASHELKNAGLSMSPWQTETA